MKFMLAGAFRRFSRFDFPLRFVSRRRQRQMYDLQFSPPGRPSMHAATSGIAKPKNSGPLTAVPVLPRPMRVLSTRTFCRIADQQPVAVEAVNGWLGSSDAVTLNTGPYCLCTQMKRTRGPPLRISLVYSVCCAGSM